MLLTLAVGMIGFGGLFAFYSYLNTALTSVGGVSESIVPVALMLFGCGMVASIMGGRLAIHGWFSPGHLLVASRPIFEPRPETGEAKVG